MAKKKFKFNQDEFGWTLASLRQSIDKIGGILEQIERGGEDE